MKTDRKCTYGLVVLLLAMVGGCVERTMTIQSNPPGALVYLNGQEVGRTPVTRDFVWYGDYDVRVLKDGYEPLVTHHKVESTYYDTPPFDLLAEMWPFKLEDHQSMTFTLTPSTRPAAATQELVQRAADMQSQLQSGRSTTRP